MDSGTFVSLVNSRDANIQRIDQYLPSTVGSLVDGKAVTLFDGIVARKVEEIARGVKYDGWYDDGDRRTIVVAVASLGEETFFRLDVTYDSWDNGDPDEWIIEENTLQQVQKVPVEKYEWKEVF